MHYNIRVIPHSTQRYDTVGDYWMKHSQSTEIRISDFSGAVSTLQSFSAEGVRMAEDYEFLVMMHEIVEAYLCRRDDISYVAIDDFDMKFIGVTEPGDAEDCPYKLQHKMAEAIEKELANMLGVDWEKYGQAVNNLYNPDTEQEKTTT